MTVTQQLNWHVTKLSVEQVLLKLTSTWPTGQEEKYSKEWRGVVEVGRSEGRGDQEETDTKQKNKNKKNE